MSVYGPSVVIPVYSVLTAVGIGLTGLRFWVRCRHVRAPVGLDDWFIIPGMIIVLACACVQFYNSIHGTGGHAVTEEAATRQAQVAHKIDFTMNVIEKPAFGAIKLSLLFFYRRIFGVSSSFRLINNALVWVVTLWTVTFFLASLLICGAEIELQWAENQMLAAQQCGNKGALLISFAVTSVFTDLLVLGLPFIFIRKLQIVKGKKWAASFVFLLGFIATFAGVLRMIFLCISYPMGRLDFGYEPPPNEEEPLVLQVFNPTFWVMIEMELGAWAANLPPLGPLLRRVKPHKYVSQAYRKLSATGPPVMNSFDSRKPAAAAEGRPSDQGTSAQSSLQLEEFHFNHP